MRRFGAEVNGDWESDKGGQVANLPS